MIKKLCPKSLISGIILGSLIFGSATYASNNSYVLSLFQAKVVVNGAEKQGSDKPYQYFNGKTYVPTSLIYSGTTYVPLRFFSETLNQPVKYDSKTTTIYVGQIPADGKVVQNMSDILRPFFMDTYTIMDINKEMSIGGNKHQKGFGLRNVFNDGSISFNLEAKYSNITGLIGLDDSRNNYDATVEIFCDDNLAKTIDIKKGSLAQPLDIDVTGVIKLDLKFKSNSIINLVDLKIK